MTPTILIVVASDNKNKELAEKIFDLSSNYEASFEVIMLSELNLPLYTTAKEKNGIPEKALELSQKFANADAFLMVAPEYNGNVPPLLNNAIAWVSRCDEKDWRKCFNKKPVALATHSGSGGHALFASLTNQLCHLGAVPLGRKIHTHYSKEFNPETAKDVLEQLVFFSHKTV